MKSQLLVLSIAVVVFIVCLAVYQSLDSLLASHSHKKDDEIRRLSTLLNVALAHNANAGTTLPAHAVAASSEIVAKKTLLNVALAHNANAGITEHLPAHAAAASSEIVAKKPCKAHRSFEVFETSIAQWQSGFIKKTADQIAAEWDKVLPYQDKTPDVCGKTSEDHAWVKSMYRTKFLAHFEPCSSILKVGGSNGDGSKFLCDQKLNKGNCVVYSLGSRKDFSFEVDIISALQCQVHTFDCTVGEVRDNEVPKGVIFHPWCIGGEDKLQPFSSDLLNSAGKLGQYYTMRTVMQKLQHTYVDILKMDIERHEFAVLKTLACPGCFGQAAIELHLHNAYGMHGQALSYKEWNAAWEHLVCDNGLHPFSYDSASCPCCVEYSFLYVDPL